MRIFHEVERGSNLDLLLRGFNGAVNKGIEAWQRSYDRRTAVIAAQNKESADLDQIDEQINKADRELK